jgi:hypothetical protein
VDLGCLALSDICGRIWRLSLLDNSINRVGTSRIDKLGKLIKAGFHLIG